MGKSVEKRLNTFLAGDIDNGQIAANLITLAAALRLTLVRIVGYVNVYPYLTHSGANLYRLGIFLARDGKTAPTLLTATGSTLADREVENLLWSNGGYAEDDSVSNSRAYFVDLRAMRKMRGDDAIQFIRNGNADNMARYTANLDMFFIETE